MRDARHCRLSVILLLLPFRYLNAFVFSPTRTIFHPRLEYEHCRAHHVKPLQMVKSLSAFHGKMKLAGPLVTLGLSLPQLGEVSLKEFQRVGETTLAAMLVIAAIQGALIIHQYSTNPAGELIVPPGLTLGTEDSSQTTESAEPYEAPAHDKCRSVMETLQNIDEMIRANNDDSVDVHVKRGWYHVNRLLILFVPLAIEQFGVAAMQYSYLMHFAVIMGLVHIYDVFHGLPDTKGGPKISDEPEFGKKPHVVVLGDSMGVGIGCVNEFDAEKNSGILQKIEQVEMDPEHNGGCGPVFPRVLARTLSKRLNRPVSWRSAGVDGGDTVQIRELLLPVVQEEVDRDMPPDVVVILTGSNDLKRIIQGSEAGTRASVRGFRASLIQIVQDIHAISPTTRVVFPSLPTYRLDTNSILNIFPLSIFLDGMIGFWDAQKKIVADKCPGALHIDLKFQDVYGWYVEESSYNDEPTLLAADGIHPNAKCYSKWGVFVGNKIVDMVESAQRRGQARLPLHALVPERLALAGLR